MPGRFKEEYRARVRAGFIWLGDWWLGSRLKRWLLAIWRLLSGKGQFFFEIGLRRLLVEVTLISLVIFGLSLENVAVSDYRLLATAYLPGALIALVWSALRLKSLSPNGGERWLLTPARTFGVGLLLGVLLLVYGLLLSLLNFQPSGLTTAAPPDLSSLVAGYNDFFVELLKLFFGAMSWPGSFDAGTSAVLIFLVRFLYFDFALALLFLLARLAVGVAAIPGRMIYRLTRQRLLWRLTFSHFWVVVAALAATAVGWLVILSLLTPARVQTGFYSAPVIGATDARSIAKPIQEEWLAAGAISSADLAQYLQRVTNSSTIAYSSSGIAGQNVLTRIPRQEYQVHFALITDSQGRIVVTTDPARFKPDSPLTAAFQGQPEAADMSSLQQKALAGETDPQKLVINRATPEFFLGGASPVKNQAGQVVLVVLLEKPPETAMMLSTSLLGVVLALSVVAVIVGFLISFFALLVALVFSYIVSRRMVRNLETLETGAAELAAGNLGQRVQLDAEDEIGRLAKRFNAMAERLQESQANLAREKRIAEQALQTKRELVANVSHELRTPVSTIRAHVDWLLHEAEEARQRLATASSADAGGPIGEANRKEFYQYLEIIGRETERLSALIEDLLDLSRIESSHLAIQLAPVEVAGVAREVKQALGLMAQRERKISLTLNLEPDLPPIQADRTRLVQVITNLTRNAINYTPAGGIISIGAKREGAGKVALWVADTGIGISPEEVDFIFDRFYRTDGSRSRHTGGAGLGLAIVKSLVEAMGGTIEVESKPGEGSIFTVRFPVSSAKVNTPVISS